MDDSLGFRLFDDVENDLHQFKYWDVDSDGNIKYLGYTKTQINKDQLTKGNLLTHYLMKDLDDGASKEFYFAFVQALRNAGYTSMTIDLTDIFKSIKVQ